MALAATVGLRGYGSSDVSPVVHAWHAIEHTHASFVSVREIHPQETTRYESPLQIIDHGVITRWPWNVHMIKQVDEHERMERSSASARGLPVGVLVWTKTHRKKRRVERINRGWWAVIGSRERCRPIRKDRRTVRLIYLDFHHLSPVRWRQESCHGRAGARQQ